MKTPWERSIVCCTDKASVIAVSQILLEGIGNVNQPGGEGLRLLHLLQLSLEKRRCGSDAPFQLLLHKRGTVIRRGHGVQTR